MSLCRGSLIVDWPARSTRSSPRECPSSLEEDRKDNNIGYQSDHTKLQVSFKPEAEINLVPSVVDMKKKYAAAYWYSDREYKAMKRDLFIDAHSEFSGTTRGIEHLISSSDFEERNTKKERVIIAVLHEQNRQKAVMGHRFDDAALAIVSFIESRSAREYAVSMGAMDATVIANCERECSGKQNPLDWRKQFLPLLSELHLDSSEAKSSPQKHLKHLSSDSTAERAEYALEVPSLKPFVEKRRTEVMPSLLGAKKFRNDLIKEGGSDRVTDMSLHSPGPHKFQEVSRDFVPKMRTLSSLVRSLDTSNSHPLWIE